MMMLCHPLLLFSSRCLKTFTYKLRHSLKAPQAPLVKTELVSAFTLGLFEVQTSTQQIKFARRETAIIDEIEQLSWRKPNNYSTGDLCKKMKFPSQSEMKNSCENWSRRRKDLKIIVRMHRVEGRRKTWNRQNRKLVSRVSILIVCSAAVDNLGKSSKWRQFVSRRRRRWNIRADEKIHVGKRNRFSSISIIIRARVSFNELTNYDYRACVDDWGALLWCL